MTNKWVNSGNRGRLYFGGLQNHCRWWLQPWNKKTLTPWKKSYDQPDTAAKSLQSCLTACDPVDSSPPSSSVPGILQARTLKWVAISFSNACIHVKSLQSCLNVCDPIDPLLLLPSVFPSIRVFSNESALRIRWSKYWSFSFSMSLGSSRQEHWSGLPFPSPMCESEK